MADVALTRIIHGLPDGTVLDFPEGTKVSDMKGLSKEDKEALAELGSIGPARLSPQEQSAESAVAQERIAALEAALEQAEAERDEALAAQSAKPTTTAAKS